MNSKLTYVLVVITLLILPLMIPQPAMKGAGFSVASHLRLASNERRPVPKSKQSAATPLDSVNVTITVDNGYGFGFGTAGGITQYFNGVDNCSAGAIFNCVGGPESYTVNASLGGYVYIVAWSDESTSQGVLAQLTDGNTTIYTGDPRWEVFATGRDIDPCCAAPCPPQPGPPLNGPPGSNAINAQIAIANASAGTSASTSVTWVNVASGKVAFGELNNNAGGVFPPVCNIDPQARWMWYNSLPGVITNPFSSGGRPGYNPNDPQESQEYLIFRIGPLDQIFNNCLEISNEKITCNDDDTFTYTFDVENLSTFDVKYLFFVETPEDVMVMPEYVTFDPPLEPGDTGQVTLTIKGMGAVDGAELCFLISVHTEDLEMCCAIEHCVTLECPCVELASLGLVLYCPFDEKEGPTAFDISGQENHGTHQGGPTPEPTQGIGGALRFDGTDDFVEVPDDSSLDFGASVPGTPAGDFSITARIKVDPLPPTIATRFYPIVDKLDVNLAAAIGGGYLLALDDQGQLVFVLADASGPAVFTSNLATSLADGGWHYVAVTVDRDQTNGLKLYIDGDYIHQSGTIIDAFDPTVKPGSVSNNLDLWIGRLHVNPNQFFFGLIEEVEVSNVALSESQIKAIFDRGKCKGAICGTKFEDKNGDGTQQPDEPGVEGWTVFIDANGDGVLNNPVSGDGVCDANATEPCAVTDENGHYCLTDLKPGTYIVCEEQRNGWEPVEPQSGCREIVLGENEVATDVNFANRRTTCCRVEPAMLDFGTVCPDTSPTLTFKIINCGEETITVNKFTSTNAAFVVINPTPTVQIPPGDMIEVTVQVNCVMRVGQQDGTIEIEAESAGAPIDCGEVAVTAFCGNTNTVASPAMLDFGTVCVGSMATQTVTLTNNGNVDIIINPSNFFVSSNPTVFTVIPPASPVTLKPGDSTQLTVKFDCTMPGRKSGTIRIFGEADCFWVSNEVTVMGTCAEACGEVMPATINFGDVCVDEMATQTFTFKNCGDVDLTIDPNNITSDNSAFTITSPTQPVTLPPDGMVDITVKFTCTASGQPSGIITVTANSICGPVTRTVNVTGTCMKCCVDPFDPLLGLVEWLSFDEAAGPTVFDSSGKNNHGTLKPDVATGPQRMTGVVDGALDFDGADDFVAVPDPANGSLDFDIGDLAIDAWINASPPTGGTRLYPIVDKLVFGTGFGGLADDTRGYLLALDGNGRLVFVLADGTASVFTSNDPTNLADGTWHHVAVTVDRDNQNGGLKLYIDGDYIHGTIIDAFDPTIRPGSISNDIDLWIGRFHFDEERFFLGKIDEVEIFNQALDPATIKAIKEQGKCKGAICGTKYNDLDGDGEKDEGEPGLEGWTIFIDANGDGVLNNPVSGDGICDANATEPCAVTDKDGNYCFTNLKPGTYTVSEVQQAGWTPTTPPGGTATATVPVSKDQVVTLDFGNSNPCVPDTELPVITCPGNITKNNDPGQCCAVVTFEPMATDNCRLESVVCNPPSGTCFPVGTTTVTCTATDTSDNTSSCTFTVTVNDTEPPTIACPPDKTVTAGPDCDTATVDVGTPTVTDNCPCEPTVTGTRSDGKPLTDPYPVGTTTITWKATDCAGNMAAPCMQKVIVNPPPCVPPPQGMVRWYPFDEATGPTAFDFSGTNNHGTHVNGPTPTGGEVAGALQFDGTNDYVQASPVNFGTGSFSFDAWVYPDAVKLLPIVSSEPPPTVFNFLPLGSGYRFYLQPDSTNSFLRIGVDLIVPTNFFSAKHSRFSTPSISPNQWTHVAATVSRSGSSFTITFYVNGLFDSSASIPPPPPPISFGGIDPNVPLTIGAVPPYVSSFPLLPFLNFPGIYYQGRIDELEIFNRALTANEIKAISDAGCGGKCKPGLICGKKLNNKNGKLLDGWELTLEDQNGNPITTATTDKNKGYNYYFTVAPGVYTVSEVPFLNELNSLPPELKLIKVTAVSPPSGEQTSINVQAGKVVQNVDFSNEFQLLFNVTGLEVNPPVVARGCQTRVSFNINNVYTEPINPAIHEIRLLIQPPQGGDPIVRVLQTVTTRRLNPGESQPFAPMVMIPSDVPPGRAVIQVVPDVDPRFGEQGEGMAEAPITIQESSAPCDVSPTELDFGALCANQSARREVRVNNPENVPLTITAITADNPAFSVVSPALPVTIPPRGSVTVTVQFSCTTFGIQTGTLSITTSSQCGPFICSRVSLGGICVPAIGMVTPTALDFGSVCTGQAARRTVTVNNTGGLPFTITAITSNNGAFTVTGPALPVTLDPGSSVTVSVQFACTTAGAQSGRLSFTTDSVCGMVSLDAVNLSGLCVQAACNVSPRTIDYGQVCVGQSADRTFTLSNTGNVPFTINTISSTNPAFTIVSPALPVTVPAGGTVTVTVRLTCTTAGPQSGTISFTASSICGPVNCGTVSVSGTCVQAAGNVNPTTLNFGNVCVGQNAQQTVTVNNSGNVSFTVNAITSSNAAFSITSPALPVTVPVGGNVAFSVRFTCTTPGAQSGTVSFSTNSACGPVNLGTVSVSGTCVQVAGNVNPTTLNFGNVTVGQNADRTFTVTNTGNSPFTINTINSTNAAFTLVSPSLPTTVPVGGSVTTTVRFNCTAAGSLSGTLSFTTTSLCGPVNLGTVSMSGTCSPAVTCDVSPRTLDFGMVTVGQSAMQTATVRNTGNSPFVITAITSSHPAFAVVSPPLPATVAAGGSVTVSVRLSATSPGTLTGTLSFTAIGGGGSVDCGTVTVRATVTEAPQCVQPPPNMGLWLSMDEMSGTTLADISGNGNTGNHLAAATTPPTPLPVASVSGMVQGALNFTPALRNYVEVPNSASLNFGASTPVVPGSGDLSADGWIKASPTNNQEGSVFAIVDKIAGGAGGLGRGYALMLFQGRLAFLLNDGTGAAQYVSAASTSLADDRWHHVAVTIDRDQPDGLKLFVDGVVTDSFDPTNKKGDLTNTMPLWIGRFHASSGMFFVGQIDEVEIFRRALTPGEIQSIFRAGAAGKCKPTGPSNLPDLVAEIVSVIPATIPSPDTRPLVTFRIRNIGPVAVNTLARHEIHFVIPGVPNSDVVLTTVPPVLTTTAINAGQAVPLTASVQLPPVFFLLTDTAQLYVVADAGGAVTESDENNNQSAPVTIRH